MSSKRSFWKTFSIRTMLVLMTVACCFVAWRVYQYERGTVNDWIDAVLQDEKANPPDNIAWFEHAVIPCPRDLPSSSQIQLLMKGMRWLPTEERRTCALKIIVEQFPEEAYDLCLEICRTTKDNQLRRKAMLLVSLFRIERDIELFEQYLDDPNPEVRSAAIDAIGVIHQPSFSIPVGNDNVPRQPVLVCDPPIFLGKIRELLLGNAKRTPVGNNHFQWKDNEVRSIEPRVKEKIEQLLLRDPDPEVRSAAARAVRNWMPVNYQLRVAEWGVWINDGENLVLAKSIIDEIPPFVHRVGNSAQLIRDDRSQSMIIVTKPIIHISVDRPLVIDLAVRINEGRPWFGFPMPDDFSVSGSSWGRMAPLPIDDDTLGSDLEPLSDVREGYPWIAPSHLLHHAVAFSEVGFRWQTLFASPEKLDWMELEPISEDKYQWWERLREVDCSWISNRGESERFLYYDGPTKLPSPVVVTHESGQVEATVPGSLFRGISTTSPLTRTMMLIDVVDGNVTASTAMHEFTLQESSLTLSDNELPIKGEDVEEQLLSCLTDRGLSHDEAMGLVDCWRPQFLETDGMRLLTIFGKEEYDRLCPMDIQPAPTEISRVGIVLTEFGGQQQFSGTGE